MKATADWIPDATDVDWIESIAPPILPMAAAIEAAAATPRVPIVDRHTGRVLAALAAGRRRIAEVGTAFGYSTLWLALGQPADGTIVTIDPDTERTMRARAWWRAAGIADDRIHQVKPGDAVDFRDVHIQVYPSNDPNEPYAASYVVTSGGISLFVSGDSSDFDGLADIGAAHNLDLALLAFGRTWYMNEEQLLAAARKLHPKTLLPFHWEFWRNHTGNIGRLFELYYRDRPDFDIQILLIGDSIRLSR